MKPVCLVIIDSVFFEHANAFERALQELAVDVEIIRIPFFLVEELTIERLKNIKNVLVEKSKGHVVLFCPGTAEYFLEGPEQLFAFSAYRDWYNPHTTRIIPHVWTGVKSPVSTAPLRWAHKPPLRIGFMGSAYSNSRLANIVSSLPRPIKHWLLRGSYLKQLGMLAFLYQFGISLRNINTFARAETLEILTAKRINYPGVEIEIVDTHGFTGSKQEKDRYIEHMERMTYIVCPRGIENFSIRMYEALKYGRIPVIIDTAMVLPKEIDWERLSVRVPYESLDRIYDIILNDYNSRSAMEFMKRQRSAFSTMRELEAMHWLTDILRETTSSAQR